MFEFQQLNLNIMTKKKELVLILSVSILLTTVGLLVDSDPKNLSAWTTAFEYFAMLTIVFVSLSLLYYIAILSFKKVKGVILHLLKL